MLYYEFYESALGPLTIGDTDGAVSSISFGRIPLKEGVQKETDLTLQAAKEIEEYLAGERTAFDLPLRPEGTPFQKRVWDALLTIPYEETRSYRDIAVLAGSPKGFRQGPQSHPDSDSVPPGNRCGWEHDRVWRRTSY